MDAVIIRDTERKVKVYLIGIFDSVILLLKLGYFNLIGIVVGLILTRDSW